MCSLFFTGWRGFGCLPILVYPLIRCASCFEMLATGVACFDSRGGSLTIGASMLRSVACSN